MVWFVFASGFFAQLKKKRIGTMCRKLYGKGIHFILTAIMSVAFL